ncbi:bile acid:sodium symporter family protein [Blastococcus saxobsidens]|uniref:Bile acid:sodium symporter family protein n=1 Tax=Blastococcus saxobsidens TaxID=138336 RepID=A0A6L9VXP9_9ACTN|nr:bile acid:sodium symporter family protein [Blastococcus saxobsidens]NEK84596.1 bile acid:sodium symporter family protein [Blastococcus saxobsidens]
MSSALVTVALPLALAVVMFGLGLSLTTQDFAEVGRRPKVVLLALGLQLLVLPVLCFGLVLAFDLPPLLAVGMLLLAASPGGTTANLFSHLFRGDVALNISLTAINSVVAVVTLPLVTNLAIGWFDPADAGSLGLQFGKTLQVFAIVLVPVLLGMLVRNRAPGFADRMDKPVRIMSAVVLALVIVGTIVAEQDRVGEYLRQVGLPAVLFCLLSLGVGFAVPRLLGVARGQAIACAFEIGVHNSTLAITVALSVLGNVELAVPAAVYGVLMFPLAAAFGWLISRGAGAPADQAASARSR